jgi:hypothetical protein
MAAGVLDPCAAGGGGAAFDWDAEFARFFSALPWALRSFFGNLRVERLIHKLVA